MKLISWNVNGLRACMNKGFMNFFESSNADIFCIQESKMHRNQSNFEFKGYHQFWNEAEKKGYSGTVILSKIEPLSVKNDMGIPHHDKEGRIIVAEYPWEDDFRAFLKDLETTKGVIVCGDLNVAHKEIDLKNPKTNRRNAGFTDEEREKMSLLLESGFIDSYRYFYPDKEYAYTWWSYMGKARENNTGWRIDYFLLSQNLLPILKEAHIYPEVMGSDHCPVGIVIE